MGFRGSGGGIGGTGLLPGPASESIDLGDAAGQGVSTRISLADHRHPVPAPNAAPLDLAAASGIGASTRPAAQDHVHRHRGVDHQLGGVADLSTYYGRSPFAARQTTGAVPAAGTVDVVVAFAQAFPDLNYTVEPAVEEATGGDTLRVRKIVSRTVNNVTIRVANQDALNPRTGTLHVLAYHDSVAVAAGTEAVDPIKVQAAPYNVIADGVYRAGAAAQLQAALDLADTTGRVIDWGAGTIVTDRLTYRCQSMIGQGRTIIQGRPSQDVFWADPTLTGDVRDGPVLRDFVVVVDDSVNAAAAFPNRGGVGNAGFAFEWNDATTPRPLRWHRGTVENVQVRSLSLGAINNSCGLYTQHPVNRMSIRNLFFHRLVYGWRDHWPAIGLAGIEHFSDHNHIDSIYFNGCTHPARWVNWMNDKISNYTQHSCANGPQVMGVVAAGRSASAHLEFGTVMIETVATNPWNVAGSNITVANLWIEGTAPVVTIDTDHSDYENVFVAVNANANPQLALTGDRNDIRSLAVSAVTGGHGFDTITDTGRGNRVTLSRQFSNPRDRLPQNLSRDGRVLHQRDAGSILLGHVASPFVSTNDLLVNPLTMVPDAAEGVDFEYAADTTADLGVRLSTLAPTNGNLPGISSLGGDGAFKVGKMLPASKGRIYIKAKVGIATTQTWNLNADGVSKGGAVLNWTAAYSVQSFEYDLTGISEAAALALANSGTGNGSAVHIAWVAFRPYAADVLSGGVVRTGGAATGARPSAVTSGAGAQFYDTTLSKPIYSDGAVWRDAAGAAV